MGNELNVDPAKVRATANDFDRIASSAKGILDGFLTSLISLGNFAGSDDFGHIFMKQFQPAVDAGNDLLSGIGIGMGKTGMDLANTADLYEKSDIINSEIAPHPRPTRK